MILVSFLTISTNLNAQTVKIPPCPVQQEWMTTNLDVSSLNNGTPLLEAQTNAQWVAACSKQQPAWCYYMLGTSKVTKYGKLYNWYAVATGKLAPAGWRVPSKADWETLISNLGGFSVAGGKIKEAGLAHWVSPNTGATNSSGFTGLPGGDRRDNGVFENIGGYGDWWGSTSLNAIFAWDIFTASSIKSVVLKDDKKCFGFSVRCVR